MYSFRTAVAESLPRTQRSLVRPQGVRIGVNPASWGIWVATNL